MRRTYCSAHYQKFMKYGDPLAGATHYETPEEAFEARTVRDSRGCLVWGGSLNRKGYGAFRVGGKTTFVHRWAYERVHGPIPGGYMIDHRCHTPSCAEASHLRLASGKLNQENRKGNKGTIAGFRGVRWVRHMKKWHSYVYHNKVQYSGGYSPAYELHVAAYRAREMRNKHYTYNDIDKD